MIVVGFDGSTASRDAVDFAVDEARVRGAELRLVHAHQQPIVPMPLVGMLYSPEFTEPAEVTQAQRDALAAYAAEVRQRGVAVSEAVVVGFPAGVLVEESKGAELMVVGARGHGGFGELLAGSVATQVATHAHCPVIVVRHSQDRAATGPIVVGVNGAEVTRPALRFAFEAAAVRGAPLLAVHVWPTDLATVQDRGQIHEAAEDLLAAALDEFRPEFPGVTVETSLVQAEDPVNVLVTASSGAHLLVVGSRGRGVFTSQLLGSTSYALAHYSHCPVAVVRAKHT